MSWIRVTAYTPTIDLDGLNSTDGKSLIGQCVRGTPSLDSLPTDSPNDTYSWSVSANGEFDSYTVASGGVSSTYDETLTLNGSTLTACFRKPETVTYECVVNLSEPGLPNFTLFKEFEVEEPRDRDSEDDPGDNPYLTFQKGSVKANASGVSAVYFGPDDLTVTFPNDSTKYVPYGQTGKVGVAWSNKINTASKYHSGLDIVKHSMLTSFAELSEGFKKSIVIGKRHPVTSQVEDTNLIMHIPTSSIRPQAIFLQTDRLRWKRIRLTSLFQKAHINPHNSIMNNTEFTSCIIRLIMVWDAMQSPYSMLIGRFLALCRRVEVVGPFLEIHSRMKIQMSFRRHPFGQM